MKSHLSDRHRLIVKIWAIQGCYGDYSSWQHGDLLCSMIGHPCARCIGHGYSYRYILRSKYRVVTKIIIFTHNGSGLKSFVQGQQINMQHKVSTRNAFRCALVMCMTPVFITGVVYIRLLGLVVCSVRFVPILCGNAQGWCMTEFNIRMTTMQYTAITIFPFCCQHVCPLLAVLSVLIRNI